MSQAVDIVKDAISMHDIDNRYDSPECRSRIAALYLPLLAIIMEVLPTLYGYESEKDDLINESVANAIATSSVLQKNRDDRQEIQPQVNFFFVYYHIYTLYYIIYIIYTLYCIMYNMCF